MKKYDSYKDSGAEWIGEIPSHWNHSSLKWYSQIFSGGTPSKDIEEYWIDGTIPWLNSGSVNQWDVSEASEFITEDAFNNSSAKWIPEESLIMALAGQGKTKGMVAQVKFKTTCNQSLGVIIPNEKVYSRHLLYWLYTNYQNIRNLGGGDKRDGLNLVMLGGIPIPIPPIKEQTAIANYLDKKTAQIDDLIAKKERLIQLLEEERTAIINQAVTKGLDPTVPMKDSGIEWLGKIPAHWDRARIKTLVKVKVCDGPHETPEWKEEGIPFISAEAIKGNQIDLNFKRGYISREQHLEYCKKSKVLKGDILFCKSGSTTGKSALVNIDVDFGIWSPLAIIRVDERKISNRYMFQSVQSALFRNQVETSWTFGTQPNIGMGALENLWIAIPPIKEQELIDEYLNSKLNEFNIIITKSFQEIELLKEYKTALISEVVTGKVDVREENINQQVAI